MPVETSARLARSAGPELVTLIRWMDQMSTAIARVEATLERLERLQATAVSSTREDISTLPSPATPDRAAILHKLRTMHAEGFSHQAMADRFNTEGTPTLSGRGRWQKGTIGKLLARAEG
jgi:hypothetical protein